MPSLYLNHIPTSVAQKMLLAVGSSAMALIDPFRHDMVAVSGEVMGNNSHQRMYEQMRRSTEGREVLTDKPRINTTTVDLQKLASLPVGTLGYEYVKFMNDNNITCDSRMPVRFVDNADHAYVVQRYREIHDMVHLLLRMPTTMLGEVVVKWIEAVQTDLPMCWGAAIFGAIRLAPKQRRNYVNLYLPWALKAAHETKPFIPIYYEKRWEQNIEDLRKELNIPAAPETLKR
ncbi:hypothetical protein B4U80_06897 [Leptotrombidium deliense]|uniref:Ubiquinone biosynthesis protein COQ4 homolog, mitochondrial n=1 Tax=Leptotrombidium deliense TaxID=299467 RepID=A0A443S568_9ACAR|nr:hypothetical protein B4U80_06897 [Leptotrombidium deliense]